jgi:hypothetical protein
MNDDWKNFTPRANAPIAVAQQQSPAAPVDINNPVALKGLAMSRLEEIVRTAPANVSLVAAIRELIDRIEGKAPQSINLDVKDKRLDKAPIDDLLRLAAMMREPMVIAPMPKKISED